MSEVSATGAAQRTIAPRLVGRTGTGDRPGKPAPARSSERPSDRIELSDRARYLAQLSKPPEVRQGLIDHVRAQIEAGTYDTPERFDAAANGIVEDLDMTA